MAWTAPRTWTDGELVTKAIMDVHVRDNLLAVGPHLVVRKPSDESVVSSTVLQNDDHLVLTLGASEVWQVQFGIRFTGLTAADIKFAFTFPTSCEIDLSTVWTAIAGAAEVMEWTGTTSGSPSVPMAINNSSVVSFVMIQGLVVNSTNAGSLTLQWAQNTSNGTATVVKANSTLWAVKLA